MVWAQGQDKWAKVNYKSSTYVTHEKSETQNHKFFFHCKLKDLPSLLSI